MRMYPLLRSLAAMLLLCLLDGCVKMNAHLVFNRNGSADVSYVIALEPRVISKLAALGRRNPLQDMRNNYEKQGYKVDGYSGNKLTGIKASKHFTNVVSAIAAFSDSGKNDNAGNPAGKSFTGIGAAMRVQNSLFVTKYTLKDDIDLPFPEGKKGAGDPLGASAAAYARKAFDLSFTLTLPVKPKSTNAPRITDEGRTLEWPIIVGAKNHLELEAEIPNIINILLSACILLLLVLGCYFGLKAAGVTDKRTPPISTE